jgi:hypothetical protein
MMVPVDIEVLRSYAGTYVTGAGDVLLQIKERRGHLVLQLPSEAPLVLIPLSETRFLVDQVSGRWIEFRRDRDATVLEVDVYLPNGHFLAHRR